MVGKAEKTLEQQVSQWSFAYSRWLRFFPRFTTFWRWRPKVSSDVSALEIRLMFRSK